MLSMLFYFILSHRDMHHHVARFVDARYILLLGIADKTKPLPWSMVNASRPPQHLSQEFLPLDDYIGPDRRRNLRLYGEDTVVLKPSMIVLHFTVIDSAQDVIDSFHRPTGLIVGNQGSITSLVSVHYMVDKDGSIIQLAPEDRITSGTYGVDHRALAIEMVAKDEADLMSRPIQLLSAFYLTDGLLKKHNLPAWRVFSHQDVAAGKLFLADYTDLADTEYPYFYPKPSFRYDPGPTVMAWCREFLLRERGLWKEHPAAILRGDS